MLGEPLKLCHSHCVESRFQLCTARFLLLKPPLPLLLELLQIVPMLRWLQNCPWLSLWLPLWLWLLLWLLSWLCMPLLLRMQLLLCMRIQLLLCMQLLLRILNAQLADCSDPRHAPSPRLFCDVIGLPRRSLGRSARFFRAGLVRVLTAEAPAFRLAVFGAARRFALSHCVCVCVWRGGEVRVMMLHLLRALY